MADWHRTAAWALLALAAVGAALPPLVLFLLKPKTVVRSTLRVTSQRPLDAFFLLDASSSVKPPDWALALDFARDMAMELNVSFPRFRAGLGQFSSHYQRESALGSDLGPFRTLRQRVLQLNGTTFMDRALCGVQAGSGGEACSTGALADITAAPAQESRPGDDAGCGAQHAAKVVLLVTDGIPTNGQAALESARHLKDTTNVTLMGVLVGGRAAHANALYALTSCCEPQEMELEAGQPACRAEANWTCPHMVRSTSYTDLVHSSEWLARSLTTSMECERVEERWNAHADLRSLWFLLLPVPMLSYVLWLRLVLLLCPVSSVGVLGGELEPIKEADMLEDVEAPSRGGGGEGGQPAVAGPPSPPVTGTGQPTGSTFESAGETLRGKAGRLPTPSLGDGGYKGKKWAPVRTAYIVAGQRLDVHYGTEAPPTAPNAARRGFEQESVRDTPEMYFADLDKSDLPLFTLTLVNTMADPVGVRAIPPHRMFTWCSVFVPLAFTLALLPPVVLWSGLLGLLGWHSA